MTAPLTSSRQTEQEKHKEYLSENHKGKGSLWKLSVENTKTDLTEVV
jgi:hypothetical protein